MLATYMTIYILIEFPAYDGIYKSYIRHTSSVYIINVILYICTVNLRKEKKRPNTVLLLPSISCAFIPYEMRWTVGKSNDEKSPLNPIQGEMAQKIYKNP